jgi:hypothetical protein
MTQYFLEVLLSAYFQKKLVLLLQPILDSEINISQRKK